MKQNKNPLLIALAGVGGVLVGIILTAVVLIVSIGGAKNFKAAERYLSVLNTIRREYVGDYDVEEITDTALKAAVTSLDDKWSYYMTAEEYEAYLDNENNIYKGIGVTVTPDEESEGILVAGVEKDQPADLAGIEIGDIILAADGEELTADSDGVARLRELIQGDYGQSVLLLVQHEDGTQEEISVDCVDVYVEAVSYNMMEDNVGYIRIRNFHEGTAESAESAIDALVEQGAESLVFDVRSDPGGLLDELTDLLDYILPEGDIFVRTDRNGNEYVFTSDDDCIDLPMAVLVNGDSYSAAEFFAAALSEYDWAVTVGTQTTGKARVQITREMPDGGAVHISHYTYLTPQRQDLYLSGGLTPDVECELDEEEIQLFSTGWLDPQDDPQVQAAVNALSE